VIDLRFVSFKSQWLKRTALEAGLPVAEAPVIYHGVDRGLFRPADGHGDGETGRRGDGETRGRGDAAAAPGCRFLYVGQVVPHKGVHTLIEAFVRLASVAAPGNVSLTVVGGGIRADYIAMLRNTVRSHGLSDRVQFRELLPRAELPAIYREHDVLVCPSIWQEPFGLTQVEAMACGIPVIGTGTGGSAEILTEETALRFPPDDAEALADRMATLAADPDRRRRMGEAALRRVADHFDLDRQVGETEAFLQQALSSRRQPLPRAPWKMPLRAELEGGR
jgi:glycosyltransferase involved in cell wall biosynthesis